MASSLDPVRAASDLPMEIPSITQSRAIARAGLIRAVTSSMLIPGSIGTQDVALIASRRRRVGSSDGLLKNKLAAEMIIRQRATLGRLRNERLRNIYRATVDRLMTTVGQ